jgi:hypothetical protein
MSELPTNDGFDNSQMVEEWTKKKGNALFLLKKGDQVRARECYMLRAAKISVSAPF